MRPIRTREEYLSRRNTEEQRRTLKIVREQDASQKNQLLQMNYSCLPNEDGSLKGSKTATRSVGMDIDFKAPQDIPAEEQQAWLRERVRTVPQMVLGKKEELGLLMLERSATKGYHLVFRRHEELSQEDNLKWASELLGVKYDDKAKDITRVFFTTTADGDELLYLNEELFDATPAKVPDESSEAVAVLQCCSSEINYDPEAKYNEVLYRDIVAKYWELFNDGKEPVDGDRNALTFELAVTTVSIFSIE